MQHTFVHFSSHRLKVSSFRLPLGYVRPFRNIRGVRNIRATVNRNHEPSRTRTRSFPFTSFARDVCVKPCMCVISFLLLENLFRFYIHLAQLFAPSLGKHAESGGLNTQRGSRKNMPQCFSHALVWNSRDFCSLFLYYFSSCFLGFQGSCTPTAICPLRRNESYLRAANN